MNSLKVTELVEKLASPVVEEAGMELVSVNFVKEGGRWYLRLFIDKPGGIGIEDCRYISEKVDKMLDERDPIPQSYTLEVSSPGIERPLKKLSEFGRFTGRLAAVSTFAPVGGKKKIRGKIMEVRGQDVVFYVDGEELVIPFKQISSARLEIEL
ncbi:MAG TPA: ribosome maturation factor RimP [Bacillota bacterium]|nr:ribosome maturation factor RimP [Bacillota bacterium]